MLESIILGMVLEHDLTGYDIKKMIENGIGVFYKASYGSLYPALKRLTEKGFLTTSEKPQGGRKKIFYHITKEGQDHFFEWLSSPMDIFEGTNTHLSKVYFFDKLSPEIRERQLFEYEINNRNYLKKLLDLEKKFNELENSECFYYKLSTLYYGIGIMQKAIGWCQHIRMQRPLSDLIESE
ncbi:PadR family transcriptional regulator [Kineothrix alysoides]|uniref:PadR family transcriptional regulator n=1 Tax=Kineothrix alysoides TaxID=1469948 RepID=A0A4R1R1T5_9FIRM|nr:PadR family transcriptional regulator [Kineothrix alysoides]TCL59310.1 PadR family transcriptional regulator [Kineothrix alysoides]